MDTIWFFLGGLLFVAMFALAARRWWSRLDGIAPVTRVTLLASTVGGLTGAVFWWLDTDAAFAWALPPLASRLLGAAATAFGIAGLFVLVRPTLSRAWLHALLTAVYLVPLTVAIVALHLDEFDFSASITWGFFLAVLSLGPLGLVAAMLRPAGAQGGTGPEAAWHLAAGAVLGLWGLALMIVPAGPMPMILIWAGDPLTSRLIGAMLLTVATALLVARGRAEFSLQTNLFASIYGLGVAVAVLVNMVVGLPWPPAYLAAFGVIGLASTIFLLLRGRRRMGF